MAFEKERDIFEERSGLFAGSPRLRRSPAQFAV